MKFAVLTAVVVAANLACALASDTAESARQRERIVARPDPPAEPKKLPATRRMLKASRQYLRQSLPQYERKLAAQTAEVQNHRTRYEQNVISQREFDSSQQTMTNTELKG